MQKVIARLNFLKKKKTNYIIFITRHFLKK